MQPHPLTGNAAAGVSATIENKPSQQNDAEWSSPLAAAPRARLLRPNPVRWKKQRNMKNRYRVATYHPRDVEDNTKAPNKTARSQDRLQAGATLARICQWTAIETISGNFPLTGK